MLIPLTVFLMRRRSSLWPIVVTITNISPKDRRFTAGTMPLRPEMNAKAVFHADAGSAEDLRKNGFGTVQSLIHDGIARGTSVAVTLGVMSVITK